MPENHELGRSAIRTPSLTQFIKQLKLDGINLVDVQAIHKHAADQLSIFGDEFSVRCDRYQPFVKYWLVNTAQRKEKNRK